MTDVTLAGLQVCREIALLGSFSAAARSLGYSQPAISRQVAAMEAAAGYPLFVRTARGVRLSEAGETLVEHAGRILAGVEALGRDLEGLGDRLAGRVALGAFPAACAVLVPQMLANLAVDHPGIAVALSEGPTPTLLRQLRAGRLAAAVIGIGQGLPDYDVEGLRAQPISAGALCVAVPHSHRFAGQGSVGVHDLTAERWIVGRGTAGDPQFEAWPTLTDPVIGHRVSGWPARFGLVAAGQGICLVPEIAAGAVPVDVAVVKVIDPTWTGRTTVMLTRPQPTAELRAIFDALRSTAHRLGLAPAPATAAHIRR